MWTLRTASRLAFPLRRALPKMQTVRFVSTGSASCDVLSNADPEQARLMNERVILVDPSDNVIGDMSKKDAHLVSENLPLHRAFSVLLFDSEGRMLLQQRAPTKITFPSYWTNTVCSHPLHTPTELGTDVGDSVFGAKRAAIRKLGHELGIKESDVHPNDLHYMTRILYRAECSDGTWGEHELDYIFIIQKDLQLTPEPNEVCDVRYVDASELSSMFADAEASRLKLTPWFCHIVKSFGWRWWELLRSEGLSTLSRAQDAEKIHVMYN